MNLKSGVQIEHLHPMLTTQLPLIDKLWQAFFPEDTDGLVITSGHEPGSHHMVGSKHFKGEAIDIRTKDVSVLGALSFYRALVILLGPRFDVIPEDIMGPRRHVHCELG